MEDSNEVQGAVGVQAVVSPRSTMTDTAPFRVHDMVHVSWVTESANCRSGRSEITIVTAVDADGRIKLDGFEMVGWIRPNERDGYAVRRLTQQDTREYLEAHGYDYDELAKEGRALAEDLYRKAKSASVAG